MSEYVATWINCVISHIRVKIEICKIFNNISTHEREQVWVVWLSKKELSIMTEQNLNRIYTFPPFPSLIGHVTKQMMIFINAGKTYSRSLHGYLQVSNSIWSPDQLCQSLGWLKPVCHTFPVQILSLANSPISLLRLTWVALHACNLLYRCIDPHLMLALCNDSYLPKDVQGIKISGLRDYSYCL